MLLVLQQQQTHIFKERETLLEQLGSKYTCYINSLLQQKLFISTTIIKQYDEMINELHNLKHHYINSIQNTNINPNIFKDESNALGIFLLLKLQETNILKQRETLLQQLESKYNNCINSYIQQKMIISEAVTKHYDRMINRINDSIYNYINNQITESINNTDSVIDSLQVNNELNDINSFNSNTNKNVQKNSRSNKPSRKRAASKKTKKIHPSLFIYVPKVNLKCEECNVLCNIHDDFIKHMKNTHSISKPYKCLYDKCDKYYKTKRNLLQHVQIIHIKKAKFECNVCHKLFTQNSNFKKHVLYHARDKNQTSKRHPGLKVYVPKVNLKCTQCDMLFDIQKDFMNHMQIKHGISKPYECPNDNCDNKYATKDRLIGHISVKHIGASRFKCNVCNALFYHKSDWQKHIAVHQVDKPFKCKQCKKRFKRNRDLQKHVDRLHNMNSAYQIKQREKRVQRDSNPKRKRTASIPKKTKPIHPSLLKYVPKVNLKCEQCNVLFDIEKDFINHMKNTHNISKPYKCDACDKYYANRTDLFVHNLYTTKFECNVCHQSFCQKSQFKRHMVSHNTKTKKPSQLLHPELKVYVPKVNLKCTQCDILFDIQKDFINHMKTTHSILKPFRCPYDNCDHNYTNRDRLIAHISVIHIKVSRFKCNVCHALFYHKGDWQRHIAVHQVDKPFECSHCKKRFKRNVGLQTHVTRLCLKKRDIDPALCVYVQGVNLKCEECNLSFDMQKDFINHMNTTHSISKPYKCLYDKCDKYYKSRPNLIEHIQIVHIKKTKFECDVCHKLFCQKSKFTKHIAKHKAERCKPFECKQCKKRFNRKKDLQTHVSRLHNMNSAYQRKRMKKNDRNPNVT